MKTEEKVLTHAIEKAASLALVVDTDRSELLANILKEAQVDPKYAKTATAAFNKRASVLEMSGKTDENRADDFALADPEKVLTLMDSSTIVKEATLEDTEQFRIKSCPAPMKKVASAPREHINYENKVHKDTYVAHLMGMLDKLANALERESAAVYNMEAKLDRDARALSGEFVKEANAFEFQCASRYFGESLKDAIGKYMPEGTVFEKKAQAIPLETGLFKKASEVVQMKRNLDRAASDTGMLGVGIKKFAADVETLGNFMEKTALNPLLFFNPSVTHAAADAIQGAAGAAANVLGVGANTIADNLDAYKSMQSGDGKAKALLDPKLVSFDRNLDRMVAFSDISADDQFKMYPAERLFRAVNSAMDYQPMLEAPASRARLKAVVGQLLTQNDRASLADITAMDAAMRHSKGYSDNPANKLPEIASAAESKAPGLSAIEPQKIRFRTDWTDQIPETRLSKLRELDNDLMAISEKEDPAAIRAALDAQRAERAADIAKFEESERVNAENEAEKQEKTKQRVDAFKTTQERKETIDRLNSAAGGEVVGLVDKLISEHTQEELEAAAKSGKPAQTIGLLGDASKRGYKLVFDKDGNMQIEVPASIAQKATPTNTTGNTPTAATQREHK
jgi:hypothetical protein